MSDLHELLPHHEQLASQAKEDARLCCLCARPGLAGPGAELILRSGWPGDGAIQAPSSEQIEFINLL